MSDNYEILKFEDYCDEKERPYYYVWSSRGASEHRHADFYELLCVSSGTLKQFYKGKMYILSKNHMYLFRPGEVHTLLAEDFEAVHFSFLATPKFIEGMLNETPIVLKRLEEEGCISCKLREEEYSYLFMLSNLLSKSPHKENVARMLLSNAIDILAMHNSVKKKTEAYAQDIADKISNHTYLTSKAQEIYKNYPIAQCTLSKVFKEMMGVTIVQYQKRERMNCAAQMLANSDIRVTDLSEMLGYDSLSHFLYSFKNEYGVTPKEYRKNQGGGVTTTEKNLKNRTKVIGMRNQKR